MSYCRWSCDDWKSDIYAYEHVYGGYQIEVASRRHVGDIPKLPNINDVGSMEWLEAQRAQSAALDKCELKEIGGPHDGDSFNEPDLESFRERLIQLQKEGYHVPDHAFKAIDEEIAEQEATDQLSK